MNGNQKGSLLDRIISWARHLRFLLANKKNKENLKIKNIKSKNNGYIYNFTIKKKYKTYKKGIDKQVLFINKREKEKIVNLTKSIDSKNVNNNKVKIIKREIVKKENIKKKVTNIINKDKKGINNTNIELKKNNTDEFLKKEQNKIEIKKKGNTVLEQKTENKTINNYIKNQKQKEEKLQYNDKFDELKKLITKEISNYVKNQKFAIDKLLLQIEVLNDKIKTTKKIEDIEIIKLQIIAIENKINEIYKNFENIKYSINSTNVYKFSNTINDFIKKYDLKIKNNPEIDETINKCKVNLDYYMKINLARERGDTTKEKISNRKQIIDVKNSVFYNQRNKIYDINNVTKDLNEKLKEQLELINKYNKLINKISSKEVKNIKFCFSNIFNDLTKRLLLALCGAKLLKNQKKILPFSLGLYLLNCSIRSNRKVISKEYVSYIPTDDYEAMIRKSVNDFSTIDYMIDDSISQISYLKNEYINEFSNYHLYSEYEKNLDKLNKIENSLKQKKKSIDSAKEKMNETMKKNCKKIQLIKNMNN